ncbi:MAG: lysophospholipid acyltransferase family protein [Candidatus Eisenbacteria sp.]|nr:lysophospholipid acyltransferase family protein [Candidatus Eisenbacteria bacterium]
MTSDTVKLADRLRVALIPVLGSAIQRLIGHSLRFTEINAEVWGIKAQRSENAIYAFWHSSLLISPFFYRNRGIVGLISHSRDGELLTRAVELLGYVIVRGSTSRGSTQAFRRLVRRLREGRDVALTPDGPRGPREVAQVGTIELARLAGKKIVPFVFDCTRKKRLNSWDRLIVPMPFSKAVIVFGDPIEVDRRAGREEIEAKRKLLEDSLNEATLRAAEWVRAIEK